MMISRIDHIQLAMPPAGEDQARSFFVELLEMVEEPKPRPLRDRGGAWFRSGDTIVHVGVEADFKPQQKAHPAFLSDDLDGLASRLEAAGYPVKWDDALPARRRFYTADPFGNRIECIFDGHGFTQILSD